ncbi:glycosyltransferase [Ketobacter sp. MCCC 1A13808]|uniref:glycosyltransferase n=1 Tax=Ketobacter sp. MCCC 1A13808 TaxID=2602738 RepID=UPI0012EC070C|nr:glycosyltransferase [Ketobacter sp. MCCC 1A13808]MVF13750.1 glycosyltransferase [Ketobacter sp. MCCC 1A13808]
MNVITPGISIVIRTLNEERFLGDCLSAIEKQVVDLPLEVIVVDSGSVDRTREIATGFGCILVSIPQGSFTFGRSLNIGVAKAQYEYVISISAHCVPVGANWLENLVKPLSRSAAELVYGAQKASITSRSSEIGYFSDRFRGQCGTRSEPEFNNGNSAFLKSIWSIRGFDEGLPAQEDVEFSQWHMKNSSATLYYSSKATL